MKKETFGKLVDIYGLDWSAFPSWKTLLAEHQDDQIDKAVDQWCLNEPRSPKICEISTFIKETNKKMEQKESSKYGKFELIEEIKRAGEKKYKVAFQKFNEKVTARTWIHQEALFYYNPRVGRVLDKLGQEFLFYFI